MVKKRTIQQKSHDESKGMLLTIFKDWIVNALDNDFGFDFEVRLTAPMDDKTQEVTEISFYVQNKSSINSEKEKAIEDLETDDWVLFLGQRIPVLITKYDIVKKEFYWEIAQDYLWDIIEKEDQNWKRRKFKRIILTKKIGNLNEIRNAIIVSQKRITRYHSLNLAIGEGIKIDEQELSKLTKIREKALEEYKYLSLREAYFARKKGDRQASIKSLIDVYHSPKNDEAKVRAIIGIIFELNAADLKENSQIVDLANQAISISEELKIGYLKDYANILRNQAILYVIGKKMSEIQLGLRIQEVQGEKLFSFYYTKEFINLHELHQRVIHETNDSLLNLLMNKEKYYYLAALPILIDIFTIQVSRFAVFNREIIKEERELRRKFIEQCELVLGKISGTDLKKMLLRSLSNYHYWTLENDKAIEFLSIAINLGKEDHDKLFVENNLELLKRMKETPNPYEVPETKSIDEMTVEEYQKFTEKLLVAQGITLESKDDLTEAISIALRDMNPREYLQHCENLHIAYLNQSVWGANTGLPSMGTKLVWCKHCKSCISGFDLQGSFNIFKQQNCQLCAYHKPRSKEWICYVKWVKEQMDSPEFRKVLENVKKSW
jgi:hypothetical protein